MTKSILVWTIIIFFCAAIFRLTSLDLIEFKLDEARDVYEMNNFFKQPHLFQLGPIQSTGAYNPPLWYYLLSIISLPSRSPKYLSFCIALINTLAICGFYLVVRKYYGNITAIVASLFMAFSPWSILLSRKIWSPDLLLPFLVPLFFFLHRLFVDKKPKAIFGVVIFSFLLGQLHASGWFLSVAVAVSILIFRIKVNFKMLLIGLVIGLIPLIPYIWYQISSDPFCPDCQTLFSYQGEAKEFDGINFLRPFEFINGSSFQQVLGNDYQNFLDDNPIVKPMVLIFLLEFIGVIAGVWFIIKYKRQSLFLVVLLAIIPVLYLVTRTPAIMHYFIILSIVMILIDALSLDWLFVTASNLKYLGWGIFGFVVLMNILFEASFYSFLSKKQSIAGDYGSVFRITSQATDEKLAGQKDNPDYQLIKSEYFVNLFNSLK